MQSRAQVVKSSRESAKRLASTLSGFTGRSAGIFSSSECKTKSAMAEPLPRWIAVPKAENIVAERLLPRLKSGVSDAIRTLGGKP
jgi:hypothetical protein